MVRRPHQAGGREEEGCLVPLVLALVLGECRVWVGSCLAGGWGWAENTEPELGLGPVSNLRVFAGGGGP